MGRNSGRTVQSFPISDSKTIIASSSPLQKEGDEDFMVPKLENLNHVRNISAIHLSKVVDAAIDAQKISKKLAMHTICPPTITERNSYCNFIKCYIDSTVILLDACNNMQLRLKNIRGFLSSISIESHFLEGGKEQIKTVLDSSCLRDKRHATKMDKSLSMMRTSGKKLNMAYHGTNESISQELNKALNASWAMSVLAIRELNFATSFRSQSTNLQLPPNMEPNQELWTVKRDGLNEKINVLRKKTDETVPMEELNALNKAVETLLTLMSLRKGRGSIIRRIAIKTMVGELQRRKDQLEKTLPQLEDKIRDLYMLISALRMSMLELLSEVQKEEDINPAKPRSATNLIEVQKKFTKRTSSIAKIGFRLQLLKNGRVKPVLI